LHIRTLFAEDGRVEDAEYDLEPALQEGRVVCDLFARFLAERPQEFREKLPFLQKGDIEMEWAAAVKGTAFAAFLQHGEARSMGVLLSGLDEESDRLMLDGLRQTVVEPMLGSSEALDIEVRPLGIQVIMPDAPELTPTLQLLMTALASVFFRAILAMRAQP
jgi:hypothetical protein